QPPKTSANWPRSFPHRSKREKPERKGACANHSHQDSALANRCFSTESAGRRLSLQMLHTVSRVLKADIGHHVIGQLKIFPTALCVTCPRFQGHS
ncbi:MAG: hypothetical protein IIX61_09390, partial [Loktanella sp.]|nr:hypothetical protein [Loktanella sp.]